VTEVTKGYLRKISKGRLSKEGQIQWRINYFDDAFEGMLFTGHLTIFAITIFLESFRP
jgi:hypothetical protein